MPILSLLVQSTASIHYQLFPSLTPRTAAKVARNRMDALRRKANRMSTGSTESAPVQLNFDTPRPDTTFGQQYNQNQASFSSLGRAYQNAASCTDHPADACTWDEDVPPTATTRAPLQEVSQNVPDTFRFANNSPPAKRRARPSVQVPPEQAVGNQPSVPVQVPYAQAPSVQAPSLKAPPEEVGSIRPVSSLPSRSEYTGDEYSGDMNLYAEQEFEQHAYDRYLHEQVAK